MSHTASTAIIFGLLIAAIAALLALIAPPIVDQASKLSEQLPQLGRGSNVIDRLPLPEWLTPYRDRIVEFLRENVATGTAAAVPLARQVATC